jgi:hypothetical protein
VTGATQSTDFPTTAGAFQATIGGSGNAFVTKLDPAGSALVYSTYLGGSGDINTGSGIAVDADGNAYLTGWTNSTNFPTTKQAFQPVFSGGYDVFVTKLDPAGSALVYSTYVGGTRFDEAHGIAVDAGGNAYVTGFTDSTDLPTTPGVLQPTLSGSSEDAFVTKLDPTGSALIYSTYLGGAFIDSGSGIAVDANGNAYVAGWTNSHNFPTTPGAFQPIKLSVGADAFVTKLNPAGTGLVYSTYLGGDRNDTGEGIAVDADGNAYVTGTSDSTNFPTTFGAVQPTFRGGFGDAFVTKLDPGGSAVVYSTYLGGSGREEGSGIALDVHRNAYVTGATRSADFPTTPGAVQPVYGGLASPRAPDGSFFIPDAFVAKIVEVVPPPPPGPTSSGTTRSEESAATEIGFWTSYGAETGIFSGGSIVASNVAASSTIFSFTGTAVSWIGVKCNVCGIAAVSIDGGAPTTVNTAGPNAPGSLTSEPVFSASGLAAANHTMVIAVTGMSSSGGAYVAVDAFDVTAGSATSPLLPPVVLPPPPVVVPPLPPIVGL